MAGVADLKNAVINLSVVREHAKKELTDMLDSVPGKKALVLDPKLSGPLGLIAEVALLKEHGVEKIYHLLPGQLQTECTSLIYLVQPKVAQMRHIADNIHAHIDSGQKKEYSVFFAPRRTMLCERALEELGVYGDVNIGEYHMDLIPFDDDVLSLEMDSCFAECFVDEDRTSLFYVARALMKLQSIFGIIPVIRGKGHCASAVKDMMLRMRREMALEDNTVVPEIDSLFLIDRMTDLITPVLTQLTYEGLIDEVFGIRNTFVSLDPEVVGSEGEKRVKWPLNSNDKLYDEIRDLNFSVLGPFLNQRAKDINTYYEKRHEAQTLGQIRDFMKNLGSYQAEHNSLRIHTNIAEKVVLATRENDLQARLAAEQGLLAEGSVPVEYIDEAIARQEPITEVLRLLVLCTLTKNGFKSKYFDYYRTEILQTYGYEHVATLEKLERVGLFRRQEGRNVYSALRRALDLIVEDVNEQTPNDIAYVYSGYAPLSIRLVERSGHPNGLRSLEGPLSALPGPLFEEKQQLSQGVEQMVRDSEAPKSRVTLIFFIGGVTYTELSALRYLQQQEEGRREFIIATTNIINGTSLMEQFIDRPSEARPQQR
eukprot:TRINITY_DN8212_c0_g1_i1.p1 TRINITY_DN8212_c0_g1~~TRINITY_DN8212_c0_g1_i1.p1  ORF type:complete len:596 (+),score=194.45 TRINITY_DN8212_c0_g1_i1:119-1906(+)